MMFAIMLPFSQLNSLMSSFLQCSGDMVTPSILNAVMCVLDIIFNALLIPVFGVMGAGMGTMLACAVISLTGAWFCCVRNPRLRLRRKEKTVFDTKILKTAFKIGVPVAVQEIAMNSAMVAATMLIAPLGSIAIAANSFAVTAEGSATCQATASVPPRQRSSAEATAPEITSWRNATEISALPWAQS